MHQAEIVVHSEAGIDGSQIDGLCHVSLFCAPLKHRIKEKRLKEKSRLLVEAPALLTHKKKKNKNEYKFALVERPPAKQSFYL